MTITLTRAGKQVLEGNTKPADRLARTPRRRCTKPKRASYTAALLGR
jgi:hypothetical protein